MENSYDQVLYSQSQNNSSNQLADDLNQNSLSQSNYSIIPQGTATTTIQTTIIRILEILNIIFPNKIPYPDKDEIPELEIKDENTFTSGDEIKYYNEFDDEKFNKCKKCGTINQVYCINCKINFCMTCSQSCRKQEHEIKKLEDMKRVSERYKSSIQNIFEDHFIPFEKSFEEKSQNFKMNDIQFIGKLIEKNYNNYFHYQNIMRSWEYLENRYLYLFDKDCIKINYNLEINKKNSVNSQRKLIFKIFGKIFVKNNFDKIELIINNKKSDLVEKIEIDDKKNYLEVILVQKSINDKKNYITDMSFMFYGCDLSFKKFEKVKDKNLLDLSQVTNISHIFEDNKKLENIDLEFLKNIKNIDNIESMFSGCVNLTEILNISMLETKNVTKMTKLFNNCKNLTNLEGISNFITDKVDSFYEVFQGCQSIKDLSFISEWNTGNANSLESMFKDCKNLKKLEGISNWNVEKVETTKEMFSGCKKLKIFENTEDLKKWAFKKLKIIDRMFYKIDKSKIKIKYSDIEKCIENFDAVSKEQIFDSDDDKDEESDN